eukprot:jgi/Mesen1/6253/ME000323S05380
MDEIAQLLEGLSDTLRTKFKEFSEGGSATDAFFAFINAVDWTEPWLIGLLSSLALLLLISIFTRQRSNLQMTIFCLTLFSIYLAEHINGAAARHWKSFSRHNYFDPQGIFISAVFSGPLLIISLVVLINTLRNLVELMVKWKRAELRHKARAVSKKKE